MGDMTYQKTVVMRLVALVDSDHPLDWCTAQNLAGAVKGPETVVFNGKNATVALHPFKEHILQLPESPPVRLSGLQKVFNDWCVKNFGRNYNDRQRQTAMGVAEEAGELVHHVLKLWQGIRGTPEEHLAEIRDAVGDIVNYLMDLCSNEGWNLQEIIEETVAKVTKRDWVKDPKTGGEPA